jgi:glycolate oxidase iron-sulfur subunit
MTGDAVSRVPRRPVDDCVHCGFCLPVCPTYVSWAAEADSPRGRIELARALFDGRAPLTPAALRHVDACLGCMACLPACPSGVRYDLVIAEARARAEAARVRPLRQRLHRAALFAVLPHPARLRAAALLLWLYRRSGLRALLRGSGLLRRAPRELGALEALAPDVGWRHVVSRLPQRTPAEGGPRARVALVAGCVQRVFFPEVNAATLRVLAAEGCEVLVPRGQGCCGALSAHAGRGAEAARLGRALVERFAERRDSLPARSGGAWGARRSAPQLDEELAGVDTVIVNAAGCGSHLKDLARHFEGDPAFAARAEAFARHVKDVSEFLAALPPRAPRGRYDARVAYHSACHLGHAQGLTREPRELLRAVRGLELMEIPAGEECCGSAGVYNLVEPEAAEEIGRRKAANVVATGASVLAAANPGCALHINRMLRERGAAITARHPIEILDASIQAARTRT